MGMYPVQNYGDDFNRAFIGMGNFINGMEKSKSDMEQRNIENLRAEKTLKLQQDSHDATIRHSDAQTEKLKRENESAELLLGATRVYGRLANNEDPTDEDLSVLGKMRVKLPYLSNNLEDNQKLRDAHNTIIAANKEAKLLPASTKPLKFQWGDHPDTDKVLDAFNTITSKDRYKTFIDTDGAVTGIKGAKYSTDSIHAGAGFSDEGGAWTAAFFSVVDDNGNPIYERDAQGRPTNQRKVVPSTLGETNDPNARINFVPADGYIMKSELALEQLNAENRLTPEQRAKLKREIEINMYGLTPGGAEKLLSTQVKDNKPIVVADGGALYSADGKTKLNENPKTATKGDLFKTEEGVKGKPGWVQDVYTDGDGNEVKRGEPRLQFNPRPDNSGERTNLVNKRDISIRLRDAQRGHQAAVKTGDPDAINEAVDMIEYLNEDAKQAGVNPLPVPNRRFSSEETRVIQEQAKKNLQEKQGKLSKVFGSAPSKPAIDQEVRRLKLTLKPGKVSFDDPQPQSQQPRQGTPQVGVQTQSPAQQESRQEVRKQQLTSPQPAPQTSPAVFSELPPAWKHSGKLIQDNATGKKLRSVKGQWVEER
jgi:hypothetical protein